MTYRGGQGSRRAAFGRRGIGRGVGSGESVCPPPPPIPGLPCLGLPLALLFALTTPAPAAAADPLRMENALPVAPTRLGGPAYIAGELQSDYPGLLEGRLRFILRDGPTVLSVVETDPIALVAGVTPFRQILPVPSGGTGYSFPEAAVEFIGEEGRYKLGAVPIRIPPPGTWEAVVLVAEPKERLSVAQAGLFRDELNLERVFATRSQAGSDLVDCFLPTLPARQFPEQPLAYCAFDLVGLPAESFQAMNGRQLDAIAAWTRAGGATCVVADGVLDPKHAEFLNGLFRDSGGGPFLRDDTGRIAEPEGTAHGVFARPAGLGFAAVLFGSLEGFDFDTPAWREAHARLWRLREEHARHRKAGRAVTPTPAAPTGPVVPGVNGRPVAYPSSDFSVFTVPTPSYGTSVINALRPSRIRLIPGWAVALLLFGYVVVVGPLDYYVLGRLRLRKWTWVTFPAVTLAVAWGVVAAADAFMSDNDHRRTVDVVDFDAAGEPVRRTRLELLFRGSSRAVVQKLSRAWFAAVDRQHFNSEDNDAPTGPYVGTLPSRYVVPQQVAKWTPQVNRTFEIAPEDVPAVPWAALEADSASGPAMLPGGVAGFRLRLKDGRLGGSGTPLGGVSEDPLYAYQAYQGYPQMYGYQQNYAATPFLEAATTGVAKERAAIQYQRSPLGFGRLDDLPFVDATDPAADVLVVWMQEPDGDLVVYRKPVGRNNGPEPRPPGSGLRENQGSTAP